MADFTFPKLDTSKEQLPAVNPLLSKATVTHKCGSVAVQEQQQQQGGGDGSSGGMPPPPAKVAQIKVSEPVQPQPAACAPRSKVPLEKGYSQVAWLRLTTVVRDLAGLKGKKPSASIPMAEVERHNTPEDGWVVLRGKVYNITPYLKYHPGGERILAETAGTDCTALFNKYHAWVNGDALMAKCFVGLLEQTVGGEAAAPKT